MNIRTSGTLIGAVVLLACGTAFAGSKADIVVMTQNQYLGADLAPIVTSSDPNGAIINALTEVSNNNYPERVQALAESISDKQPHLVALQEVYRFTCFDPHMTDGCDVFPNAFNDHLAATLAELGGQYRVAAVVNHLDLGVPVYLGPEPIYVQVLDRDVILARSDVETSVVNFNCSRPSVDGCNFINVAPASVGPLNFNIERGFVGVDAMFEGADYEYRFINTHLEVKQPSATNPGSALLQPVQATELLGAIFGNFDASKRLIIAGDFNSSPLDVSPLGVVTAYQQFANGMTFLGGQLPLSFTDLWYLRPGMPDGFTCCELGDLSNAPSQHYERVDLVFAWPAPADVKANVLDAEVGDKTMSGLWPSDHASVSVELSY